MLLQVQLHRRVDHVCPRLIQVEQTRFPAVCERLKHLSSGVLVPVSAL